MTKTKEKQKSLFKHWYRLCEPNKLVWFFQIFYYVLYAASKAMLTIFAAKTIDALYNSDWHGAFLWLAAELISIIFRNVAMHLQYIYYAKHYGIIRKNITEKICNKIFESEENGLQTLSAEKIINIAQNNMGYAAEFPDYIAGIIQINNHNSTNL